MTSHKVNTYLNKLSQTAEYQELFSHANQLNKMQHTFSSIIPPYLEKGCRLGNISNNKLIIYAQNGAIASKLKLIAPSLLQQLQKIGWNINAIKISIQMHQSDYHLNSNRHNHKAHHLSQAGIESLQQFSNSLSDSELKKAVQSLLSKNQ